MPDIRIRFVDLPPSDITTIHGLRVTTLQRTLVDLAGELPPEEVARMIGWVVRERRLTVDELINVAIERTDIDSIEEFRIALALYLEHMR